MFRRYRTGPICAEEQTNNKQISGRHSNSSPPCHSRSQPYPKDPLNNNFMESYFGGEILDKFLLYTVSEIRLSCGGSPLRLTPLCKASVCWRIGKATRKVARGFVHMEISRQEQSREAEKAHQSTGFRRNAHNCHRNGDTSSDRGVKTTSFWHPPVQTKVRMTLVSILKLSFSLSFRALASSTVLSKDRRISTVFQDGILSADCDCEFTFFPLLTRARQDREACTTISTAVMRRLTPVFQNYLP